MRMNVYRIDGMHGARCAKTIEALLGAEPGVQRAYSGSRFPSRSVKPAYCSARALQATPGSSPRWNARAIAFTAFHAARHL